MKKRKKRIENLRQECINEELPFMDFDRIKPDFYQILKQLITTKEHEKKAPLEGIIITDKSIKTPDNTILDDYLDNSTNGRNSFRLINFEERSKTIVFNYE